MQKLGLYLHIPFCVRKCRYCDFYSTAADSEARTAYVRALCRHLEDCGSDIPVDTVYFGGGTPTMLGASLLADLLYTVKSSFAVEKDAEITVECNPVTNAQGMMDALRSAGFNRLSIGLQSIHPNELELLGRPHTDKEFLATYRAARAAGFDNINADVMFGIPAQTIDSLAQTLEELLALSPEHISAYGLRIEEGTPFYRMRDQLVLTDEDAEVEMAELVSQRLRAAGYEHYEVSNYARMGRRSRHNMRYWLGQPYLGFGPGAHSFVEGVRYETPPDRAAYMQAAAARDWGALVCNAVSIAGKEAMDEYVMLRMRLFEGVLLTDFERRFGCTFGQAYGDVAPLVAAGLLYRDATRIAFTERGMQVSNSILSDWLDFGH